MSQIKRAIGSWLFLASLIGTTPAAYGQRVPGGRPGNPEVRGVIKTFNPTTITLTMGSGRDAALEEKTYAIAKDVEVCTSSAGLRFGGVFQEAKLKDLSEGTIVLVGLSADQKSVESIVAEEPMVRGQLKSVDAKKHSLTITTPRGREDGPAEKTYRVAADAEIGIDDGRSRRFSIREGKLEDLEEGAILTLRLSLDKGQVTSVLAEGATFGGTLKSIDAAKRSLTLVTRPGRGDDAAEERTITISKDAVVLLDDGRARRLSVKKANLVDVPVGSDVLARLSADQNLVMMLKAEGPALLGLLKGVDVDKRTITIGIPINRAEFDEKTFPLAKEVVITLDGMTAKTADLKVGEDGPILHLRLTLDQKAVQSVHARQRGSR